MGFWEVAGEIGKAAVKGVQEKAAKIEKAKEEAYGMSDEQLASRLNNTWSSESKMGYVQVAKERGTIGHNNGKYYVR